MLLQPLLTTGHVPYRRKWLFEFGLQTPQQNVLKAFFVKVRTRLAQFWDVDIHFLFILFITHFFLQGLG